MPQHRHLSRAPIVEAIVDLRVELPADLNIESLRQAHDSLREEYPTLKERRSFEGAVTAREGHFEQSLRDHGIDGYLFTSADKKRIVQFRLDGFTYNRLEPYPSWNAVAAAARQAWDRYAESTHPEVITRIALRYINKMPVPRDLPLDRCLTMPPRRPGRSHALKSFVSKVVVEDTERRCQANIVQAMEPTGCPDTRTLVLDVDVYMNRQFEPSDDALWDEFDRLREAKNEIFFNTLTDEMLERFV